MDPDPHIVPDPAPVPDQPPFFSDFKDAIKIIFSYNLPRRHIIFTLKKLFFW
jgi:hypothetical protein